MTDITAQNGSHSRSPGVSSETSDAPVAVVDQEGGGGGGAEENEGNEECSLNNRKDNNNSNSVNFSFPAIARLASVIASKVSMSSSSAKEQPQQQQQQTMSTPSSPRGRPSKWSPSAWRRRRQRKNGEESIDGESGDRRSSPNSSRSPSDTRDGASPRGGRTPSPRGGGEAAGSNNTLQVPSSRGGGFFGAVPKRQRPVALVSASSASSTDDQFQQQDQSQSSEMSTPSGASAQGTVPKRCFCGLYSEGPGTGRRHQGMVGGRCRLCRSRAKYVSGHKSFDTAATSNSRMASFFDGGYRGMRQARRAISEDRRSDGHTTEDTSASTSSATTAQSSFDDRSPSSSTSRLRSTFPFSTPPFLRRQDRMETMDPPSPNFLTVPSPQFPTASSTNTSSSRDHGLRTPPAPPSTSTSPLESASTSELSHRMAHEMPEYLVPPPRSNILGRAHTDPASLYEAHHRSPPLAAMRQQYHVRQQQHQQQQQPISPPPTYSEAIRGARLCAAIPPWSGPGAPPSYEEALSSTSSNCRIPEIRPPPATLADQLRQQHQHPRSLSEERTGPTAGAWSSSSSRGRYGVRPLTRSSRAEEIPDIYWEQAARELDFCTCRKCQARYRQYFEESPLTPSLPGLSSSSMNDEGLLPMETQVFMQEVLTDGIAFCTLM